jgi:hypothetical protein
VERNGKQAAFGPICGRAARTWRLPSSNVGGRSWELPATEMDVDSYNQNHNSGEVLQMVFDFTLDLEEIEALAAIA